MRFQAIAAELVSCYAILVLRSLGVDRCESRTS